MSAPPSTATTLEAAFGDPFDATNPVGFAAIVAADERGEPLATGESLLDAIDLNAEFVPAELGGRLETVPGLVDALRPVFRRDVALGLGYGVTTFMAAVNVWSAGSPGQRRWLADTLLARGRAAVAYHELDHGNDMLHADLLADVHADGIALTGEKHVINNVDRAAAIVLFARTDAAPGGRSHSILLVDAEALDARHVTQLPPYRAVGVRGCRLGGVRFAGAQVPHDAILGDLGEGVEIALRSFQITRSALPGMAVGALDSALRTTLAFAVERQVYGTTVAALPHARATLAGAFADLLACDALATVATRALHVIPAEAGMLAAATKYLVPRIIGEALYDLSVVLGARFYLREGEHAIFQKIVRDAPVLSLGHAGSAACQATLLPHLARLARQVWTDYAAAPASLFDRAEALPPLCPAELSLGAPGADNVLGTLRPALRELPAPGADQLRHALAGAHARLQDDCRALRPAERTSFGPATGFDLAARYALLLAASACANVWLARRNREGDTFAAQPAWALAALTRLAGRLHGGPPTMLDAPLHDALFAGFVRRLEAARSLDLDNAPLFGADRPERTSVGDAAAPIPG